MILKGRFILGHFILYHKENNHIKYQIKKWSKHLSKTNLRWKKRFLESWNTYLFIFQYIGSLSFISKNLYNFYFEMKEKVWNKKVTCILVHHMLFLCEIIMYIFDR